MTDQLLEEARTHIRKLIHCPSFDERADLLRGALALMQERTRRQDQPQTELFDGNENQSL